MGLKLTGRENKPIRFSLLHRALIVEETTLHSTSSTQYCRLDYTHAKVRAGLG